MHVPDHNKNQFSDCHIWNSHFIRTYPMRKF